MSELCKVLRETIQQYLCYFFNLPTRSSDSEKAYSQKEYLGDLKLKDRLQYCRLLLSVNFAFYLRLSLMETKGALGLSYFGQGFQRLLQQISQVCFIFK